MIQRALKWLIDRLAAFVLLLLLSPLLLGLAVWILVDDGRPVVFSQRRAGKNGRPFGMLKFRTMVNNASQIGLESGLTDDPFGVLPNDPRITRSGHFLRRFNLDELPQLWNVLVGQMSLVGPRPDVVEQVANYQPRDRERLAVLPGITGLAQVEGRDEIPWEQRFELDRRYIANWSLALDFKIFWRTFFQFGRPEPTPIPDRLNVERAKAANRN
jgi:lipopolysaccharide/colanic/teichoic acid biosynthesis glycosyltransferase